MTGRILIADGVATNRMVLKAKLCAAFYDAVTVSDPESCLRIARDASPDLILLDWSLPEQESLALLRELRLGATTKNLPVIVTMADASLAQRLAALAAGADEVMHKPLDDRFLLARLRSLLRAQEGPDDIRAREATLGVIGMAETGETFSGPGIVAVLSASPESGCTWRDMLAPQLTDRIVVQTADEALGEPRHFQGCPPDLYLIEAGSMSPNSGLRLLSDLKSRRASRHAAMCLILPDAKTETAEMGFDLGAQDIVPASINPAELAIRIENLLRRKRLSDSIRSSVQDGLRLAVTDPLTGLFNRRYGLAQLDRMLDTASRSTKPLAVMVIDLDRFKLINDSFGHAAGDAVLVEVARRLSSDLRSGDLLARIGGEEFLVVLPDTNLADGQRMAARLCCSVQREPIRAGDAVEVSVTASIGLTVSPVAAVREREQTAAVVARADHALLSSKAAGRNQVTIARTAA